MASAGAEAGSQRRRFALIQGIRVVEPRRHEVAAVATLGKDAREVGEDVLDRAHREGRGKEGEVCFVVHVARGYLIRAWWRAFSFSL